MEPKFCIPGWITSATPGTAFPLCSCDPLFFSLVWIFNPLLFIQSRPSFFSLLIFPFPSLSFLIFPYYLSLFFLITFPYFSLFSSLFLPISSSPFPHKQPLISPRAPHSQLHLWWLFPPSLQIALARWAHNEPPKPKPERVCGDFIVHKAPSPGSDRAIRCVLCLIFGHDRKQ